MDETLFFIRNGMLFLYCLFFLPGVSGYGAATAGR